MNRLFFASVILLVSAVPVMAHFVFVVPETSGLKAQVIVSENLEPDADVKPETVDGTKLVSKDSSGKETPLTLEKAEKAYLVDASGTGTRVIYGVSELGVRARKDAKPFLLVYHPKTIIGDAFDAKTILGESAVAEIVPQGKIGAVKFQVLSKNKPAAGIEVTVILPDGSQEKVTTDKDGETTVFNQQGRYGLWARIAESASGEKGGKKYEEVRHYPTLVMDAGTAPTTAAPTTKPASHEKHEKHEK